MISHSNFIEITIMHGCSPTNFSSNVLFQEHLEELLVNEKLDKKSTSKYPMKCKSF